MRPVERLRRFGERLQRFALMLVGAVVMGNVFVWLITTTAAQWEKDPWGVGIFTAISLGAIYREFGPV
jgi:hypothetical protein